MFSPISVCFLQGRGAGVWLIEVQEPSVPAFSSDALEFRVFWGLGFKASRACGPKP